MRHHFVTEDCSRFSPTKTVNRNQYGLTHQPRARLTRTNVPAIMRILCSKLMALTLPRLLTSRCAALNLTLYKYICFVARVRINRRASYFFSDLLGE